MKPILEPILLGQDKSILCFNYEAAHFETPWHFHPQHELTYIEESVGTKLIGDYVGPYEAGELVLLRSNLPHCWKNNAQTYQKSKSIVIQWNRGVFPKVPELELIFSLLRKADKGLLFNKEQTKELLPLIQILPTLKSHELYVQLLQLLSELAQCQFQSLSELSFRDDIPTIHGTRMLQVHEFVQQHFQRKVYLKEVADLVKMSEQSFSRFFKKMMGRSFFTFLNEFRVNMAVRMLLDSDKSVSQVGYDCGYESLPFFYKQFNKYLGCTPLNHQKKYKK